MSAADAKFNVFAVLNSKGFEEGADGIKRSSKGGEDGAKGLGSALANLVNPAHQAEEALGKIQTVIAGFALEELGREALKLASDFDAAFTRIDALYGVGQESAAKWREEVLRLSPEVGQSSQALVKGLDDVVAAGGRGDQAIEVLRVSAKLTTVGLGDMGDISRTVARALDIYSESGLTAAQVGDQLLATLRNSKIPASQLASVYGSLIDPAQKLGISFAQVGGFLSSLSGSAQDFSQRGGALKGILQALITPSQQARDALKIYGTSIGDLRKEVQDKGLAQALQDLVARMHGNVEALSAVVPGFTSLNAVLGKSGQAGKDYVKVASDIANANGLVDKSLQQVKATPKQQWEEFKNAVEDAMIAIGEGFAGIMAGGVSQLAQALKDNERLFAELGQLIGTTVRLVLPPMKLLLDNLDLVKATLELIAAYKFAAWISGIGAVSSTYGRLLQIIGLARSGQGELAKEYLQFTAQSAKADLSAMMAKLLTTTNLVIAAVIALGFEVNVLIKWWAQQSDASIQANVAAANAQGSVLRFREALRAGKGTVSKSVFDQAQEDAQQLQEQIKRAQAEVDKFYRDTSGSGVGLDPSLRNVQAPAIKPADLQAAEANLGALRGSYQQLGVAVMGVRKVVDDTAGTPGKPGGLSGMDDATIAQIKHFQQLQKELLNHIAGEGRIVAAYDESTAAGQRMTKTVEAEGQALSQSAELTGSMAERIRLLSLQLADWVQKAAAAARISSFTQQVKDANALLASYARGLVAVDETKRKLAEEKAVRDAVGDATGTQAEKLADLARQLAALDQAASFQETADGLVREIAQFDALHRAYGQDLDAANALTRQQQIDDQVRQAVIGHVGMERLEIERLTRARAADEDQVKRDTTLANIQDTVEGLRQLAAVQALSFKTDEQYQDALTLINQKLEFQRRLRDLGANATQEDLNRLVNLTNEENRLNKALTEQQRARAKNQQAIADWTALAHTMAEAFGGMDTAIGKLITSATNLAQAWLAVAQATTTAGRASAGAQLGGQISGLLGYQGLRGQSSFGGQLSGDYSQAGGALGGAIGGVIGGILTSESGGWGAPIGSIIGGILGTVIGGAIKKGADEGSAHLNLIAGQITTQVTTAEGGLGKVVSDWGEAVKRGLNDILGQLGGVLNGLPLVDIKVRDEIARVIVGNVQASFKSIDEAVHFAIAESLKQADISGLSSEVRTVLKNTTAATLDELASDLDFAKWVQRLGLPEVAVAVQDLIAQFGQAIQRADQLGLATDKISQWYARQLSLMRDQVLGIQQSPEDQLRANVAAFNQQVTLTKAQEQMTIADLTIKKADLEIKIQLAQAEALLEKGRIATRVGFLDADVAITQAGAIVLQTLMASLAQVDEALKIAQETLAGLPALIDDKELQDALARLKKSGAGGKAAGGGASEKDSFIKELTDDVRLGFPDAVKAVLLLNDQLAELTKKAHDLHIEESLLAAARQALIDSAKKAITDPIAGYLRPNEAPGGTFGLDDFQQQEAAIHKQFDDARAANAELLKDTGQKAIDFWLLNLAEIRAVSVAAEKLLDGLNLPARAARNEITGVANSLRDIGDAVKAGALDASEARDAIHEMAQAAQVEVLGIFANLLEQEGRFDDADKVRRAQDEINFHIQLVQLDILYTSYVKLGFIAGDLQKKLDPLFAFINDPANWPDFSKPAPSRNDAGKTATPGGGSGGHWVFNPQTNGWVWVADASSAGATTSPQSTASDLLKKYEQQAADAGLSDGQKALRQINDDFQTIFTTLGRNSETLGAFNAALHQAFDDMVKPLRDLQKSLLFGAESPLTAGEKFNLAKGQYESAVAAIRSGDLGAIDKLPDLINQYLQQSQATLPQGSEAYRGLFANVQQVLSQVVGIADNQGFDLSSIQALLAGLGIAPAGGGPAGAAGDGGTGGAVGGGDGSAAAPATNPQADLLTATRDGSSAIVAEIRQMRQDHGDYLRQIRDYTYSSSNGIQDVRDRLDRPLIASIR